MADVTPPRWSQQPLIPQLVPLVKWELTVIMDGVDGTFTVGHRVTEHLTDELLAMGCTNGRGGPLEARRMAALELPEVHDLALRFLSPF